MRNRRQNFLGTAGSSLALAALQVKILLRQGRARSGDVIRPENFDTRQVRYCRSRIELGLQICRDRV